MVEINESMDAATKQKNPQAEQDAAVNESLQKIKNKFIVLSGKGGVGKTSTAVNLAIALSKKGFKVGIMDVDLQKRVLKSVLWMLIYMVRMYPGCWDCKGCWILMRTGS